MHNKYISNTSPCNALTSATSQYCIAAHVSYKTASTAPAIVLIQVYTVFYLSKAQPQYIWHCYTHTTHVTPKLWSSRSSPIKSLMQFSIRNQRCLQKEIQTPTQTKRYNIYAANFQDCYIHVYSYCCGIL